MKNSVDVGKWLLIASIVFLSALSIFTYGFAVSHFRLAPYTTIDIMASHIKSYVKFGAFAPEGRVFKAPAHAARERLVIHKPELVMEGYYAYLGNDQGSPGYAVWLYDHLGRLIHTWPLHYSDLDLDGPSNGSTAPHGFAVLRDGSMILNFDKGDVMARIDSCGKPLWIKAGVFHHSLVEAEDGSFWTWRGDRSPFSQYQYLVNFEALTGTTIREIGLIEDVLMNSGGESAIFLIRPDFPFKRFDLPVGREKPGKDIFHPNDIDVLYSDAAHMFPGFEGGDLLISLRRLNLIAVIDPDNFAVKWWSHGPWRAQHDPDFVDDGTISVYNNNPHLQRSEIIKINPTTRKVSNDLYNGEVRFYSRIMGKHQYLPNGNVLIVIPDEGRVIVASHSGQRIMEFNNLLANRSELNAHVKNAAWIPKDYFSNPPEC